MNPTSLKIVTRKELEVIRARWKNEGQKVVFTNGVFDLIHLGHVDYLEKARNLGDKFRSTDNVLKVEVVDKCSRPRVFFL